MRNFKRILALLEVPTQNTDEKNIQIAKGKYKMPRSIRGIYRVQKRTLKHRSNGGNKNG
tara:strand:+ start:2041 stop:2217 length:177 start_codon:yes stop_codon:yes gene_type:complete